MVNYMGLVQIYTICIKVPDLLMHNWMLPMQMVRLFSLLTMETTGQHCIHLDILFTGWLPIQTMPSGCMLQSFISVAPRERNWEASTLLLTYQQVQHQPGP